MISIKDIDNKLETVSKEIYDLYTSPNSGLVFMNIYTKYFGSRDDRKHYGSFVGAIGEVILGFYKVSDLPNLLIKNLEIEEDTALAITRDMLDFLTPVSDIENQTNNNYTPIAILNAESGITIQTQADEQETTQLEPIHTMQSDLELLKKNETETNGNSQTQVGYQPPIQTAPEGASEPLAKTPSYNDTDPTMGNPR